MLNLGNKPKALLRQGFIVGNAHPTATSMFIYNFKIDQIYRLEDKEIELAYDSIKRWRKILLERTTTNRPKVINLIEKTYKILELPETPIVFEKGMNTAIELIRREYAESENCVEVLSNYSDYQRLREPLHNNLVLGENQEEYFNNISPQVEAISEIIGRNGEVIQLIHYGIFEDFYPLTEYYLNKYIDVETYYLDNSYLQYFIEELKIEHNPSAWDIFKNLTQECPYLIPLSKFCIVIEQPIEIHLDNEQLPHAQNKPAMIFGDGTKLYYHHGIPYADKYGDIPISSWQPEWILSERYEYDGRILIHEIGYKRFHIEYPDRDFWQDRDSLLSDSIDIIINWQLYHYNQLYLKHLLLDELTIKYEDVIKTTEHFPFKLPMELSNLYHYYNGGYQLAPDLYFYSLKRAIKALPKLAHLKSDRGYPFPLFQGDRDKIYYILADNINRDYSHVYCVFPGGEPMVYAECVTSLIVTIAQCYQEGCYYIETDRETGIREIKQDLDRIEAIFDKFNPDQIDVWRKIWKS
jgi:hypothetical protein